MDDQTNPTSNEHDQTIEQPLWVALAFSMIEKRKHAIWLILANFIFALYCIPWSVIMPENALIANIFRVEDWSWVAILVPILIWYFLCYRWMSKHRAWKE